VLSLSLIFEYVAKASQLHVGFLILASILVLSIRLFKNMQPKYLDSVQNYMDPDLTVISSVLVSVLLSLRKDGRMYIASDINFLLFDPTCMESTSM
jgi:hypothetical protein